MTAGRLRTIPSHIWDAAGIDGAVLRRAREAAGMTQRELALEHLAVDPRTISLWEMDRAIPQPSHRARLVEVLNLNLEPADE